MDRKLSIRALTLCHAAMGALLGALAGVAVTLFAWRGGGEPFGPASETAMLAVVAVSLSAWSAVGAGLSGFLLVNVERAHAPRPGGRPRHSLTFR
ncbi:MAG: hypothetical protein ACK4UO_07610 [Pseudolabrys sp.]